MTDFVHLHLHTQYSLLDGACKFEDLMQHCVKNGIDTVAVTDHGNMYCALHFAEEAAQKGLKYIIGCEFYMCSDLSDKTSKEYDHLILLAKNKKGYKNLVKLNSIAYVDGFYYKPRIDYKTLEQYSDNLICLSACLAGKIPQLLLKDDYDGAKKMAKYLQGVFGEDFYIEIQDHGLAEQKMTNPLLVKIANEIGAEIVATNDVHYLKKEDWKAQDVLMCIQMKKTLDDPKRMKFDTQEFYFKSGDEMAELFKAYPKAISNTRVIADKVTEPAFDLDKKGYPIRDMTLIPGYDPPDHSDPRDYLRKLTMEGLKKRYDPVTERELERADYELNVICSMGFAEYYLIVWDFINWSKEKGIPVGPGRGSGVGSIVAYSIGITDVEPLQYDLLFERFLNPDRVSMPDFDIDFCTDRRQETIEYVREKYHPENVCQIITFGTLASKAAIKDIGRVMKIPYSETDRVAKIMDGKSTIGELMGFKLKKLEDELASSTDLSEEKRDALVKKIEEQREKRNAEFIEIYETNESLHEVIDMALKLEGMPRNTSMHAAGVVICRKDISQNVPLSRNGEDITTQFVAKEIEALGMLKMDFLALVTLTDIKKCCDYIYEDYGVKIDFPTIGYNDPKAYEIVASGDTDGIFQLEQGGMKKFMMELKPDCLEDLIAGVALYRPGPMQFIPEYCKRKNGLSRVTYDHPLLEPILKVTYGIIIYQEQVMQIFQNLAGFSLGEADLVRRAMGKKDKKTLMAQKDKFIYGGFDAKDRPIKGCVANGVPADVAAKVFGDMESFASYAFNKSHAAAYATLAYQTAYLKRYYPKEFICGILNNRITKSDEITKYVLYMKDVGMKVLPPDVNKSKVYFSVQDDGVRFGLSGLKGVGIAPVEMIIKDREENGEFTDFADFLVRCTEFVNKRVVEGLILSGAFDTFGKTRSQLYAVYDATMSRISGINKQKNSRQISLFGSLIAEEKITIDYPNLPEFELDEKLSKEKLVTGVYISGHPFEKYARYFTDCSFSTKMLADYEENDETGEKTYAEISDGDGLTFGGMISSFKRRPTERGVMFIITVEDLYGSIDCVAFGRVADEIKNIVREDAIVRIKGKFRYNPEKSPQPGITVDKLEEFTIPTNLDKRNAAARKEKKEPVLWLNASSLSDADFAELQDIMHDYTGETLVKIKRGEKKYMFRGVRYCRGLIGELMLILDEKDVVYLS